MTTGAPRAGLRERKKRRTRDQLEGAAFRLFEQRGFDAVTVDDIASEAEVSPRTFFRYFPSKEDVLFGDIEKGLATLRAEVESSPPGEPVLEVLRRTVSAFAADYESGSHLHPAALLRIVVASPGLTPHLLGRLAAKHEELTAAIANHRGTEPSTDLYAHLVAACALDALRVSLEMSDKSSPHRPATAVVGEAFDLLAKGFRLGRAPGMGTRRVGGQ
jgi:AcrR family transcriptional regulator